MAYSNAFSTIKSILYCKLGGKQIYNIFHCKNTWVQALDSTIDFIYHWTLVQSWTSHQGERKLFKKGSDHQSGKPRTPLDDVSAARSSAEQQLALRFKAHNTDNPRYLTDGQNNRRAELVSLLSRAVPVVETQPAQLRGGKSRDRATFWYVLCHRLAPSLQQPADLKKQINPTRSN